MKADCVILAGLPAELEAVKRQFRRFKPIAGDATSTHQWYETFAPNGLKVVASAQTTIGNLGAASLTHEAVALFQPRAILLVGIAGGMDHEIPLGDVVVSEQIVDYDLGKVTSDGFSPRWSVYRPDAWLLARAKSWSSQSWQDDVRTPRPTGTDRPALRWGVYLSSNKVVADERTAGVLRSVWRKAAAIEMEAAGVASVLWHTPDPPAFIVFKGLCDYADSQKNDDWQPYAAEAAAACAFSFIFDCLGPSDFASLSPSAASAPRAIDELPSRALRQTLALNCTLAELKTWAFDVEIDWEEITPGPKSQMITDFILYARRHGRLSLLMQAVNRDRDNMLAAYVDR